MPPILRNSPKSYRSCILYEFQLGRSLEEAYKNFCRYTKNDNFYYVEFAYWFNRFANGKIDLDDESFDIQPKSFLDLPMEMLGEIVGKLDLVSRLRTRKVSRNLRSVVDKQKANYNEICIFTEPNQISIYFDHNVAYYIKNGDKCLMEYGKCNMQLKQKVLNGDFLKIALNDLEIAMKKPRFQTEWLSLSFYRNFEKDKFRNLLESLKSPIHAKSLEIVDAIGEDVLSILSLTKPGTLEKISIGEMDTGLIVDDLVKMEQWKQAKRVEFFTPIEYEHCINFDSFNIYVKSLSTQDVIRLPDILSQSKNFEYCRLDNLYNRALNIVEIGTALGATVVQSSNGLMIKHRHSIPRSNEFFEIEIRPFEVIIEKKT